jgi:hypothetical protein
MKSIPTLSLIALGCLTACSSAPPASPTHLPPGEYSKTEKSTNMYGTETTKETNTDVYYDEHGHKRAVQETETTRDPDGLFNQSKTRTVRTY